MLSCLAIFLTITALLFIFADQLYIDSSIAPKYQSNLLSISLIIHGIVILYLTIQKIRQIKIEKSNNQNTQNEPEKVKRVKFNDDNINQSLNTNNKTDKYNKHLQIALKIQEAKNHAEKFDKKDKTEKITLKADHIKLAQKVHRQSLENAGVINKQEIEVTTPVVSSPKKSTIKVPKNHKKSTSPDRNNNKDKQEKIKAHDQNIERHKNFVRRATLIAIHQEHQIQQAFLNGGVDFNENTAALHENDQLDEKSDVASHKASQNTYYSYGVEARSESRND